MPPPEPEPTQLRGELDFAHGNSSRPGSVPPYMAVIVSSKITLPNSTTAVGNVVEIVVISTKPGYKDSLNQAGTGTVLG